MVPVPLCVFKVDVCLGCCRRFPLPPKSPVGYQPSKSRLITSCNWQTQFLCVRVLEAVSLVRILAPLHASHVKRWPVLRHFASFFIPAFLLLSRFSLEFRFVVACGCGCATDELVNTACVHGQSSQDGCCHFIGRVVYQGRVAQKAMGRWQTATATGTTTVRQSSIH